MQLLILCFIHFIGTFREMNGNKIEDPVAKAKSGTYVGFLKNASNGNQYLAFTGIKYGNAKRFQMAEMVEDSNKVFHVNDFEGPCFQGVFQTINGVEDCLYLNVYTCSTKRKVPVVVYIHGGGYSIGSGNDVTPDIWMDNCQVVFVTIDYRLGLFGFLDFNSDMYPSNLGIQDQILALKWLNRNVEFFGGTKTKITLYGQSSGGASVDILMHSRLAKGLFQAGISSSGTMCASWALAGREKARRILIGLANATTQCKHLVDGEYLYKPESLADHFAPCLMKISPEELVMSSANLYVNTKNWPLIFQPVVEGRIPNSVIRDYPWNILTADPLPWISGVIEREDVLLPESFTEGFGSYILSDIVDKKNWKYLFNYESRKPTIKTANARISTYYNFLNISSIEEYVNEVLKAYTSYSFYFANYECHSYSNGRNYNYFFGSPTANMSILGHGDELDLIFHKRNLSKKELKTARTIVEFFTSFATYHFPEANNIEWLPWDSKSQLVLQLSTKGFNMTTDPMKFTYGLWKEIFSYNK